MRRVRVLVGLAAVAIALAGCAGGNGGPGESEQPTPRVLPSGEQPPALELVGLWRVSDADGADSDTWLRLGEDLALYRPCGWSFGDWRASGTAFLGSISGWTETCGERPPTIPWLQSAVAFQGTVDGLELLDGRGAVVARLRVDGVPPQDLNVIDDYRTTPALTDRTRSHVAALPPTQLGREALTAADLIGRWTPSDADPRLGAPPFIEFATDGSYRGSDGANGVSGRWSFPAGRQFLATGGPTTLIGSVYDLSQVGTWLVRSCAIDMDHGELVLLDADGTELGRLTRG